jgi:hypothetical protein
VHALQDARGELRAAQAERKALTFDRQLALWSGFEGEATLYEEVMRALLHERDATWVVERIASRTESTDAAIIRQRRPLEASFATFPYVYGALWTAQEAAPPVSTHQILGQRYAWPSPNAQPCDDPIPTSFAAPSAAETRDTLGAWLVQAFVRRVTGDAGRARAAARSWRGDSVARSPLLTGANPSFAWQSCWDSPERARELSELIAGQLQKSAGDRAHVTHTGERVLALVRASPVR